MRVGIVGAGIGGTCLAHGLRKDGVDVVVYERDTAATAGLPGYGIHINVFGQQAIQECVPERNWQEFKQASRPVGGKARFYDENLTLLACQKGSQVMDGRVVDEQRLSISRSELKDVLNAGLAPVMKWEKQFVRYERLRTGSVRVEFADGTADDVDVLVGADGPNSKVRKQYLPNLERIDLGVTIVAGRTRLTNGLAGQLPAALVDGSPNSVVPRSANWLFVSVWRAPADTSVDAAHSKIETFVVWAYVAAATTYPINLPEMLPPDLCELVCSRITGWNKGLRRLIEESDLPSVNLVHLRSMPHLSPWPSTNVTLLGDAIHNMTPMAGVGANTALRDALLLTHAFTYSTASSTEVAGMVAGYERRMRAYANRAVALSRQNALYASDASAFKRGLFRFALRTAEAFPVFKHILFPTGR